MKLIDKDALVAEINRRIIDAPTNNIGHQRVWAYNDVKEILDTLEVKEVYLEKKLDYDDYVNFFNEHPDYSNVDWGFDECWVFAKHFFELGLRSTITKEDCKLIWNIGDEIPNMPEEEFFKELLKRYKAQKGE